MPSSYGNRQKHESRNPIQRRLIARFHHKLARLIDGLQPSSILEVGCGEGYVLEALRRHGITCPLAGIDFSAEAVDAARLRVPDADLAVDDALSLAQRGQRYDLVLMIEVLEHIDKPERMLPVLERIASRSVVLSVPWEPCFRGLNLMRGKHVAALGNDPEHVNHWSHTGFVRFVEQTFTVRSAKLAFPWTLVAAQRMP